jgi:hypothetical protein
MLLLPAVGIAQEEQEGMRIKGNIKLMNKTDNKEIKVNERLWYGMFSDHEVAEKARAEIEALDKIEDIVEKEKQFKAIQKKHKILGKTSASTRSFDENVMSGMSLLFVTTLEYATTIVDIRKGVTEYKDVVVSVQRTGEVIHVGKMREGEAIGAGIVEDRDDGYERFNINLKLMPSDARRDARLIVQTYAVDCQTEDTVDYCRPVVAEGVDYHILQNKRMAYNFMKNDKLAFVFDTLQMFDGEQWYIRNLQVQWKKIDTKRTYMGPFHVSIEDYHHVFKDTLIEGTCLRRRPFKLLDFSPALAQVKLTSDFYEDAKSQVDKKMTDLSLVFEVGTDQLTADSMNQVKCNNLIKELRSYGDQLMNPVIEGSASPDGSRATNETLARKRAERAKGMVAPYLPRHATPSVKVTVHTWEDVVAILQQKGHAEEADAIKNMSGDDIRMTQQVKAMPTYDAVIEPVLQQLRSMKCKYQVLRSYVMSPEECVEAWHKHKQQYLDGTKHFSGGDYYNLFDNITDSVELDELTLLAYKEITQIPDYEVESKMAPYVANRFELMNLRRDQPNSCILAPFIDYSRPKIDAKKPVDDMTVVTMNRREIVTNQAVTFYQEHKLDSALYLIRMIKKSGIKDKNIEMLEALMDLKRLHPGDGSARYKEAKDMVLGANNDNKAILYTEIDQWDKKEEAPKYIRLMDDENPKKWYLKALLAVPDDDTKMAQLTGDAMLGSDEPNKNDKPADGGESNECYPLLEPIDEGLLMTDKGQDYFKGYMAAKQKYQETHDGKLPELGECLNTDFKADGNGAKKEEASKEPEEEISLEGIPHYLAYMQACFDIDPAFKKYYFAEGAINEKLRKKFPYKKKNVKAYRLLFEKLEAYDKLMQNASSTAKSADSDDNEEEDKNTEQ